MGQRCSNTTDVIFEEVKVGSGAVVGGEGNGFKVAMRSFDRTRPWIAAGAAGIIRRALDESSKYALERKTFGVPIAQHQAVQFMLAEMAIAYESTRLLCHKAAWGIDTGKPDSIVSSYAKAYGADAACGWADAVRSSAATAAKVPRSRLMRDAKLFTDLRGDKSDQRMVIARHLQQPLLKLSIVDPRLQRNSDLRDCRARGRRRSRQGIMPSTTAPPTAAARCWRLRRRARTLAARPAVPAAPARSGAAPAEGRGKGAALPPVFAPRPTTSSSGRPTSSTTRDIPLISRSSTHADVVFGSLHQFAHPGVLLASGVNNALTRCRHVQRPQPTPT